MSTTRSRRHALPWLAAVTALLADPRELNSHQRLEGAAFLNQHLPHRVFSSKRRRQGGVLHAVVKERVDTSQRSGAHGSDERKRGLKPGMEFDGKVLDVKHTGAVVELVPSGMTGFLHVSQMRDTFVKDACTLASAGDVLRVRVLSAKEDFLELTLKNIGKKSFDDFEEGQKLYGRVEKVTELGAFVDVGSDRCYLLHRGQMRNTEFVKDARDLYRVGDKVTTHVRRKHEDARQLELTMLNLYGSTASKPGEEQADNRSNSGEDRHDQA
mmetsp:Transcript_128400/g.256468  ORF Transcript_128400/g.256468 Transcript_128400/m.256468 type:complete len:269 (+) Transcript_128400:51-857(+)